LFYDDLDEVDYRWSSLKLLDMLLFFCLDDIAIMIDDVSYLLFDHFLNIAASNSNDLIVFFIVYSVQSLDSYIGLS
jgi:hypothetical protein